MDPPKEKIGLDRDLYRDIDTAIKHADRPFISYYGSGLPPEPLSIGPRNEQNPVNVGRGPTDIVSPLRKT